MANKDGGFIKTTDHFSESPLYINPEYVVFAMPIQSESNPKTICRIMISNGMMKDVEKLPEELEDWGKME